MSSRFVVSRFVVLTGDNVTVDEVRIIKQPLVVARPVDVDAFADRMWITLPDGYRDFVTRLGEGMFSGYIRIYPPWRIENELASWRQRIKDYWFWAEGAPLLPQARAAECIVIGDTIDGDELVFHPARPQRLFLLPRHSQTVLEVGTDLLSAIEWICTSGKVVQPFVERDFTPFDSRDQVDDLERRSEPADPKGGSLEEILELGRRWSTRHGFRAVAEGELQAHVRFGNRAEFMHESFVIDRGGFHQLGYVVSWRVVHALSGDEVGVFTWNWLSGSYGSRFEPK
jgi:hypothetical protein